MRRAWQDFAALFGSMGHPAVSIFLYWLCAALAYPLTTEGGYAGAVGGAFIFCIAILFLAYSLGCGALAFAVDAKRSCLPGSLRLTRRANLLSLALLAPAFVLPAAALAGSPVWRAWVPTVLVLGTALAGVVAPLLPIAAVGLFLLVVLTAYWAAGGQPGHERSGEVLFSVLSAALALAALAKWRQVIRRGSRPPSLARQLGMAWARIGRASAKPDPGDTVLPHVTRPYATADRVTPVEVVRTCLGGMFVRMNARQRAVGAGLIIAAAAVCLGMPWIGVGEWRWTANTLVIVGAVTISSGFLRRLTTVTRAEFAELALIPGLGDAPAQRRTLCQAVLAPPLWWLGAMLVFGSTALLLKGAPLSSVGVLAMSLLFVWLIYSGNALQKLTAGRPMQGSFLSEFMTIYLGIYAPLTLSSFSHWFWWVWLIPVFFGVGVAIAIYYPIRRLATAPHPFLA